MTSYRQKKAYFASPTRRNTLPIHSLERKWRPLKNWKEKTALLQERSEKNAEYQEQKKLMKKVEYARSTLAQYLSNEQEVEQQKKRKRNDLEWPSAMPLRRTRKALYGFGNCTPWNVKRLGERSSGCIILFIDFWVYRMIYNFRVDNCCYDHDWKYYNNSIKIAYKREWYHNNTTYEK